MADMHTDPNERLLARLVFFSDAVFAIVLTLLVLELRPPPGETNEALIAGLWGLTGHFVAFVTSFALVGVFWIAHLSLMRLMTKFDWRTAIINLLFLFTIALMPFASSLLGEHGQHGIAWSAYCAALMAASAAQALLLISIAIGCRVPAREFWYRFIRALSPGIAFAVGFVLNVQRYELAAAFCWVLIPVVFLFAQLVAGSRKAKVSAPAPAHP